MKQKKKRSFTLIEIMIVILLIGIIGSVIGVNMKGSLDSGRAFKTEKAIQQIEDIFMMEVAKGTSVDDILAHKAAYLEASGLVKNGEKFLKDGWGQEYEIRVDQRTYDRFIVTSKAFASYQSKKDAKLGKKQVAADESEAE